MLTPGRPTKLGLLALGAVLAACASSTSSAPSTGPATAAPSTSVARASTTSAAGTAATVTPATSATVTTATTAATATTSAGTSTTVLAATTTSPATSTATTTCTSPATGTVQATDLGNHRDLDVTSFDGTTIRAHWFPASSPPPGGSPTVLMGPGWGSGGDTDTATPGLLGSISINAIRDHGYNVMTWDPRGFGASAGTVEIDSADHEGRDVEQLISWVAAQPGVQLDAPGDPRLGMVGGSYGGAIQLVTAAIDCRVDAIVPIIAWHSLVTSLAKADTPKIGWGNLLSAAGGSHLDPVITAASKQGNETGTFTSDEEQWFAARGPADLVSKIHVPTLIIQGTVDTLFTLDEGIANYQALHGSGAPLAMLWFCGGHGTCLTDPGDTTRVGVRSLAWLDRWVKRDTSIDPGPGFEMVDQHGTRYTADSLPQPTGAPIVASGADGTLTLTADGGSGPPTGGTKQTGVIDSAAFAFQPGRAAHAVNLTIPAPATTALIVGSPRLELTYQGTSPQGARPTRIFAQLVDDTTNVVLGNQITPIVVVLDGNPHSIDVPLETVAHRFDPGTTITLQLVATTAAYAPGRLGGEVQVVTSRISLPVVDTMTAAP